MKPGVIAAMLGSAPSITDKEARVKKYHRHMPLFALMIAGLLPAAAQASARCEVIADSMARHPAAVAELKYPATALAPAHEAKLRVQVAADGTPKEVEVESPHDAEPVRRSAQQWRYRCEGNQGGTAEWAVSYAAQHCKVDLTSKAHNPPRYPPAAFRDNVQGTVLLALQPQGDGKTARLAYVTQSSGSPLLDDAALAAGKRWTFACGAGFDASEPAQEVPIRFVLN